MSEPQGLETAGNLGKGQQRESRSARRQARRPTALLEEGSGVRMPDPSPMPALGGGLVLRWQMVDGHTL